MTVVRTTFTSDDRQTQRSFDRLNAELVKTKQQMAQLNQQQTQQGVSQEQVMTRGIALAGQFAAALGLGGGIAGAIGLANRELERMAELSERAFGVQAGISASRATVIRNLPGVEPSQIGGFFQQLGGIARTTGVSEQDLTSAFADAISAAGGPQGAPQAIEAVRQAARFFRDSPEAVQRGAGSFQDVANILGTTDIREAAGFISQVSASSRVVQPEFITTNLIPALANISALGGTPETAGRLFTALTVGGSDPRGAVAKTGGIALAEQMREFFGASGGRFKGQRVPSLPEGLPLSEQIGFLQQNPEVARQFLDAASFEKQAVGTIENLLLDPSSAAARSFQGAQFARGGAAVESFERSVAALTAADPLGQSQDVFRRIEAAGESAIAREPRRTRLEIASRALERASEVEGASAARSAIDDAIFGFTTFFGQDPAAMAQDIIQQNRFRLQHAGVPEGDPRIQGLDAILTELQTLNGNQQAAAQGSPFDSE